MSPMCDFVPFSAAKKIGPTCINKEVRGGLTAGRPGDRSGAISAVRRREGERERDDPLCLAPSSSWRRLTGLSLDPAGAGRHPTNDECWLHERIGARRAVVDQISQPSIRMRRRGTIQDDPIVFHFGPYRPDPAVSVGILPFRRSGSARLFPTEACECVDPLITCTYLIACTWLYARLGMPALHWILSSVPAAVCRDLAGTEGSASLGRILT